MVAWRNILGALGGLLLMLAVPLHAQLPSTDLGLQGTAAYNLIWNGTAQAEDCFCLNARRFTGRVAVRLTPRFYVGVSVGSWEYPIGIKYSLGETVAYDALATSVVLSSYGQFYLSRWRDVFVRGGVGYAANQTYYPNATTFESYFTRDAATHPSVTAGLGVDWPIRSHLAITLSSDYTSLLGTTTGREAKSGLLVGIGLTVR